MDCPRNIAGSASPLFFQNKESPEYRALLLVASTLAHPQRAILANFVLAAADRDAAARLLLRETSEEDPATVHQFLAKWIALTRIFRPIPATNLNEEQKQLLRERDGNTCCFSRSSHLKACPANLVFTYIVSPSLWADLATVEDATDLYPMLEAFVGETELMELRTILDNSICSEQGAPEQALLVSKTAFDIFQEGRLSLKALGSPNFGDSAGYIVSTEVLGWKSYDVVSFKVGSPNTAKPPHPLLLGVNHRFSEVLSWIYMSEHMITQPPTSDKESGVVALSFRLLRPLSPILQQLWCRLPVFLRSYICQRLVIFGHYLYGVTLSDRVHRLPFGLYLRIGTSDWAARHQSEFEALRLVEAYTTIPAPRAIDTFKHQNSSYLLMTRIPGRPIGIILPRMTDDQVHKARQELSGYITQLRSIPNMKGSGICSASGTGILDWRIGDSKREELMFPTTADFHRGITAGYSKDILDQAYPSHSKDHEIVFTHGDINPRNVLADENGNITGIVDWECSGWFPEYWEYIKAHFTVRYTIRWLADVVDLLFTGYREELCVENMLNEYAPFI